MILQANFENESWTWEPKKFVYRVDKKGNIVYQVYYQDTSAQDVFDCDKPTRAVIAISMFFLVLTLFLHIIVKTFRKPNTIMTMALVINLLITFGLHLQKSWLELDRENLGTGGTNNKKNCISLSIFSP